MFNIRITTKFQSNCPFRTTKNPEALFKMHKISFNVFSVKNIERRLDIRFQVSSTSHVTGPTVKTTSKGVGKAKRDWNTANAKAFKHLWKKGFILQSKLHLTLLLKGYRTLKALQLNYFYSSAVLTVTCKAVTFTEFFLTWN